MAFSAVSLELKYTNPLGEPGGVWALMVIASIVD